MKSVLSCPNVALSPPHVCHRRRTGLSSLARTCSRRWSFLLAAPHLGAPVFTWTVHQKKCKTQIATTSRWETMLAAREYNAYFALFWATSARQCTTENPEVSKLAIIIWQMRKLLATCLRNACFTPQPGALAEHFDSSRMNWKVRFHSHGSSLMIDSNTQRQPSGTLF